jgi:Trk K+ transport system NAD-binding subunit
MQALYTSPKSGLGQFNNKKIAKALEWLKAIGIANCANAPTVRLADIIISPAFSNFVELFSSPLSVIVFSVQNTCR